MRMFSLEEEDGQKLLFLPNVHLSPSVMAVGARRADNFWDFQGVKVRIGLFSRLMCGDIGARGQEINFLGTCFAGMSICFSAEAKNDNNSFRGNAEGNSRKFGRKRAGFSFLKDQFKQTFSWLEKSVHDPLVNKSFFPTFFLPCFPNICRQKCGRQNAQKISETQKRLGKKFPCCSSNESLTTTPSYFPKKIPTLGNKDLQN